jgi:hypothetical protein
MRKAAIAFLGLVSLAAACGDDDAGPAATTTHAEGGGGATGGTGGTSAETFAFDFALYDLDTAAADRRGHAISGAQVALDVPSRDRQALVTDAEGKARIVVPKDVEYFTWTVAKPGRVPVRTFYRVTVEEVQARLDHKGELFTIMAPLPEPVSVTETTVVTLSASVPFCSSAWYSDWCSDGGEHQREVLRTSQPFTLVAHSVDEQGCPVELREVTLPDTLTDHAVELDFDGSNPAVAERFDITMQLPEDPSSLLNTDGPLLSDRQPFWALDADARIRGGACNKRYDAAARKLDFTISYFPKGDEDLAFYSTLFVEGHGTWASQNVVSQHFFGTTDPGPGTYHALDIPELLASPAGEVSRSSHFSWRPVPGARSYLFDVMQHEPTPYSVWSVATWHQQDIDLPDLPDGYDPASDWGDDQGTYRVRACDGWEQFFVTPYSAFDPDWKCGSSETLPGSLR